MRLVGLGDESVPARLGRLCCCGTTNPRRVTIRQIVATTVPSRGVGAGARRSSPRQRHARRRRDLAQVDARISTSFLAQVDDRVRRELVSEPRGTSTSAFDDGLARQRETQVVAPEGDGRIVSSPGTTTAAAPPP